MLFTQTLLASVSDMEILDNALEDCRDEQDPRVCTLRSVMVSKGMESKVKIRFGCKLSLSWGR